VDDDELDPREAARIRRREHDAEAARRELMRSGMGKVFKQILDRRARDAERETDDDSRDDRRPRTPKA